MPQIYVKFKPRLWCLMLHQPWWSYQEENPEIQYCTACKENFFYPTKKEHEPVYTR